jgi:hypothetical protein
MPASPAFIAAATIICIALLVVLDPTAALPFKGPEPICNNLAAEQRKVLPAPNTTKIATDLAGISASKWLPDLNGHGSRDDLLQLI